MGWYTTFLKKLGHFQVSHLYLTRLISAMVTFALHGSVPQVRTVAA